MLPDFGGWHERAVLVDGQAGGAAPTAVPEGSRQAQGDDRRVLSGILHVLRNGLRWRDAPAIYGPHKTLYNRFARWSRVGVVARIFRDLAQPGADGDTLMIDSTHLKAHRTAASLRKGGRGRGRSAAPRVA